MNKCPIKCHWPIRALLLSLRCQDILSGRRPNGRGARPAANKQKHTTASVAAAAATANAAALNPDEEDHSQFEKDMTTIEATQVSTELVKEATQVSL